MAGVARSARVITSAPHGEDPPAAPVSVSQTARKPARKKTRPTRAQPARATHDAHDSHDPHPEGNHLALRLWLRLLTCHNLVEARLRGQLRSGFDTTLPRFDLMAQLQRYPDGLKMRDLSRLLMVTGGNVTGLTDRLVEEGLIERRDDPNDRRAWFVSLTPKGQAQFAEMAALHEEWVIALFDGLSKTEQTQLAGLLDRLRRHLGNVAPPASS